MKLIWNTPLSQDGERKLRQHAFIQKQRGKWYQEKYEGNVSLCRNVSIVDESERFIKVSEIELEPFNIEICCKKCAAMSNNMQILEDCFNEKMIGGDFESFKKDYPTLLDVILESMCRSNKILN